MSHIIKILSERQRVKHVEYAREFQAIGQPKGCGYSFTCDVNGNLDTTDENYTLKKENYDFCIANPEKYIDEGVVENSWTYMENAKALCSCGETIELYDQYLGACNCPKCGQWYNLFGQALLDPEYWEEDY